MARRETLGTMACPECGAAGAEIKAQKNGLLYRWCADGCNAQFFARTAEQEAAMRKHLKAAPVTDTAPEKPAEKPAAKLEPEPPAAKPAPKRPGNPLLDILYGAAI